MKQNIGVPSLVLTVLLMTCGCAKKLVEPAPPAVGQTLKQVAACSGETRVSSDDQISACTAVIKVSVTVQQRAEALQNRCWAYTLKWDYDAAISDCNEALRLLPDDRKNVYGSTYNRATAYDGKGDYEKAIDDFTRLLQFDPRSANLLNSRANAYTGKGDYTRAIADYSQSIALNKTEKHRNKARQGRKDWHSTSRCHASVVKGKSLTFNAISCEVYSLYRFFADHSPLVTASSFLTGVVA